MKTNPFFGNYPMRLFLAMLSLPIFALQAGYRQVGHPDTWKLASSTEIYSVENPDERLTTLRKNLEVEVLDVDTINGIWIVRYDPAGSNPIVGAMKIPDLSEAIGALFQTAKPLIGDFPLLQTLLESDLPWGKRLETIQASLAEDQASTTWDTPTGKISTIETETGPALQIEFGNQGNGSQPTVNPAITKAMLSKNLGKLERIFRLDQYEMEPSTRPEASADEEISTWVLPNDIVASVHYLPRDHLTLVFESFEGLQGIQPEKPDPYEIAERMKVRKYTPQGDLFLGGIPFMPGAGRQYGPYAALACAMAYYGYPIDIRKSGISDFESTSYGTDYKDLMQTSNRFFSGTPLHLFPLGNRKHPSFEDIRDTIDTGNPILFSGPGGMRLITGFHPESHDIVYRDTWGRNAEVKTMSWEDFCGLDAQLWIFAR